VTLDYDLRVVPDIAERWEISPDGRTYTFYLRRGVKFHNGREVTAEDFKYSFERAADPKTQSPVAETYLGDIVGVVDKLNGRATEVAGVRVVDRYTLQITIDAPKVYFLAKLTYPTAFVVDREQILRMGRRWTEQPNGTGPFKLKEYKVGERIVLERNPDYYRGPPQAGPGGVDPERGQPDGHVRERRDPHHGGGAGRPGKGARPQEPPPQGAGPGAPHL
jgi:oligopeptide transport system substrate-binding protein